MLEKMYLENIEDVRSLRSLGEHTGTAKVKRLDLQFYLRAVRKRKWLIVLFTALVMALAVLYLLTATPIYGAKATLLLESQKANIISIEELVSSEQESLDYFGTQYAILRSRALAERVMRSLLTNENYSQARIAEILNVPLSDPSGELTDPEFQELLIAFQDSLSISPVAKTKLVTINYESTDAAFSALAADAVANQYIASVLEQRKSLEGAASLWMDSRIAQLQLELDESEKALLSFKISNNLVSLNGDVGRLNEQELMLANSELNEANNKLSAARDLFRKIQSYKSSNPELLETLPFVQSDILVRTVKGDLGEAQRTIDELRNRYGSRHPTIVDAESRMQSLRSTLDGHIARTVASFESDYQLLQQRVASLQANVSQGRESIQLIGQQKITLDALEREVSANRDQYNRLFDRITETRTADGLDQANAVVAEAAWVQTQPVKPNKKLILAMALLGSLMLSAVVAFLIEFLDDTVSSTDDVERRLNTKLLGVIPLIKGHDSQDNNSYPVTPFTPAGTSKVFAEAVNTCRTGLSIHSDRDLQIILVTSSIPDEGKSTVALNLANSFGKLHKTLLIDCDLRQPSIGKALGIPENAPGLSSFLLQKIKFKTCMNLNILRSFDCVAGGPVSKQPLEMLSSAKFAKTLEVLRGHYDKIIIDSAPTTVVSDALILSKLADGVMYVVKPHHTSMKLISSGLSRLAEADAKILGVCVSQFDAEKARSGGALDFHGFGVDSHHYGNYYRDGGGRPHKQLVARLPTQ